MDKNPGGHPTGQGAAKADGLNSTSEIGRKLKQYYDELVTEQVPDRFMDLLKQLDKKETGPAKD